MSKQILINASKVYKVYSGRQGCMCGCRGKWTCSSTASKADREYTDVSDRSVKIIVGKLSRRTDVKIEEFTDVRCYFVTDKETGRTLAAYEAIA